MLQSATTVSSVLRLDLLYMRGRERGNKGRTNERTDDAIVMVTYYSIVGSRGYLQRLCGDKIKAWLIPAKPNCWFLSYSVQYNLLDTAEKTVESTIFVSPALGLSRTR